MAKTSGFRLPSLEVSAMTRTKATLLWFVAALLAPASARAAVPAEGVPQAIRSGLFADVNLGGFLTIGGRNASDQNAASVPQAYMQVGLGYDLARHLSLAASFGLGSSASSCYAQVVGGACLFDAARGATPENTAADNFTVAMFAVEASTKLFFTERLTLRPRLHLGFALLEPEPRREGASPVDKGFVVGAGVGLEYATHLDHVSVGADLFGRLVTGPNLLAFALYPKIKYTF
jgi:hypothetical protein